MGEMTGVSTESLRDYGTTLQHKGTVVFPPGTVFGFDELERIHALQSHFPEERVSGGDAHDEQDIYVRRILTDRVGEVPSLTLEPYASEIMAILDDEPRKRAFATLLGSSEEYFIRRCQTHRMAVGSYLGAHIDVESNPHNEFSVVIQLGRGFEGGEFVVHPEGRDAEIYATEYGSVLVTACTLRHEVWKVRSRERHSVAYFYSRYRGPNLRDDSVRCTRPNCQWCGEHLRSRLDGP